MEKNSLSVQMLGCFSLNQNGRVVSDSSNRSKKVWLLLAYMIYNRNRAISQSELISLLWGGETVSANPVNALKTMFHRLRTMLDGLDSSAGHSLIIRREGSYAWNPAVPFQFDLKEFSDLCMAGMAAESDEVRLEKYLAALKLYQGDFLPKLSSESWVAPISAHFHNLYLRMARETLDLLESQDRLQEAVAVGRRAVEIDPYDESLYQHLMRDLLKQGDHKGVVAVYQTMSDLLFSNFGIMPSDETKALYREAAGTINQREISLSAALEQLRESPFHQGALYCDYDFFRTIYQFVARVTAHTGDAVHIGLLTVSGKNGAPLAKRSMDVCMENLKALLCSQLPGKSVVSRCSFSQYVVMLPLLNYEAACSLMEEADRAFFRQYPHSPAALRCSVQPLEPSL